MSQILLSTLDACRTQFAEYRDYHINKLTPDSLRKAATNQEMIDMIDDALRTNLTDNLTPQHTAWNDR